MTKLLSLVALLFTGNVGAQELDQSLWNSGINHQRYSDANKELIAKGMSPTAVLMGDSITDMWVEIHPEFFSANNLVDRGISGETTGQMLMRFRADVIELKPNVVAILAGINDIAENTGPISIEDVFKNIVSMTELARFNSIEVVLCKLVPANRFPWRERIVPTAKVRQLNELIETYAKAEGIVLVDYFSAMANDQRGLGPELSSDGVHPNAKGYAIMEPLLVDGIQAALGKK